MLLLPMTYDMMLLSIITLRCTGQHMLISQGKQATLPQCEIRQWA